MVAENNAPRRELSNAAQVAPERNRKVETPEKI